MSTDLLEGPEVAGPGPETALPDDQARALAELEQIMGFHISLAELAIKAHFQKNFAHLGLTQKQIAVMWLVDSCPGIIQVDIARMLRVQRATIAGVVTILTARGLLRRAGPGTGDARHVPLELTDDGRAGLEEAKVAIERHENWVKQHLTAADQRTIASLMGKIYRSDD
jgi:MarR family transcriptional regulator, organic hydroperoxide resistance regulator